MERTPSANNEAPARQATSASSTFSVKSILGLILRNWYWFVLSLIVALGLAYLKIQKTPPMYSRTASILIKSDANSGDETLKELGITQTPSNLTNEILMMNNELKAISKNLIPDQIIPRMRELRGLLDKLDLEYFEYYNGLKS